MAREVKGPRVRYAVVGGGSISQMAFMPGIARTRNSEMTALVTGDPVKADRLAKKYGLKSYHYDDYAKLLASGECDAVYVATPNHLHTPYVIPALEAGIHVLLEKPMATSEADCQAMRAAAKKSGAKLMVAYRLHFEPGTVELIERVRAGEFGRVSLFNSTFSQMVRESNHRAHSGYWAGPVPDMGPYPINAVRNLFGAEPIEVRATGLRISERHMNFDDVVSVTLKFPGERLAQFVVSYSHSTSQRYELVGDKGSVEVSPAYMYGPDQGIAYRTVIGGNKDQRSHRPTEQFGGETEYFSQCVLENRDPEPDGEEGWLDVRVLAAVERALTTGEPQKLQAYERARRPVRAQVRTLEPVKPPELINTEEPSE
ncbi:Gfo/Idh/MocA family protein [Archangium primigenium]|uniref:Gfo/Idh/MocA family protein n=1 Tax=[Archangium] primigenium TaxID=2792470 RepID=UPI00195B7FB1|nr:Gfo/Idh/MocA family oxidoreductase [Archangium primigenium]MBM7115557.1 Gfo/Idh/MocA family oxidoreductase [Archangium primigenium]